MTNRIRVAIFSVFSILMSCIASCQYNYDFNLCGTVVNSVDETPVEEALVRVLPYEEAFFEESETLSIDGKSTVDATDTDGQYKVYFRGTAGGCRQSIGPSYFDSLYVRVLKPGYETIIVGVATDAITYQFPGDCYTMPPIRITPDGSSKP